MPLMPSMEPRIPTQASDKADLWRALQEMERRLTSPAPPIPVMMGTVTSKLPAVRVLGRSVPVPVWRITPGVVLEVGDEVCCADTTLGLVVLSVVVEPLAGVDAQPPLTFDFNRAPIPAGKAAGESWFMTPGDIGWSTDLTAPTLTSWKAESLAPPSLAPSGSIYVATSGVVTLARVFPVPAGTAALIIRPGDSYAVSAHFCLASDYDATDVTCAVGVDWYDSAGDYLSQSQGSAVGVAAAGVGERWLFPGGSDIGGGTWVNTGPLLAAVTAPGDAAYARPYLLATNTANGGETVNFWASSFDFGNA